MNESDMEFVIILKRHSMLLHENAVLNFYSMIILERKITWLSWQSLLEYLEHVLQASQDTISKLFLNCKLFHSVSIFIHPGFFPAY